ncbi:MAG: M28 family peptidase, partial [bacterium]|nr:M28 family peptidase [bacterium]
KANFIGIVSNISSKEIGKILYKFFLNENIIPTQFAALPEIVPGVDFSDHLNFWKFGYKAIMITDTAFYRNPNYHTLADTPDNINYKNLEKITKILFKFLTS